MASNENWNWVKFESSDVWMAGVCEEVPFDFKKALKQSRILVIGKIRHDSEVLRNLISLGFKDIEVVSEDGFSKADAEIHEKNIKSCLKMLNIEFHTSRATDYGINFIKRFNVVISIADDLDVINYLKLTCSAANVSLVDKEMILLSEKVVKEKFKIRSGNMVMELMAVYLVLQNFEEKQRAEVVISKTKEDDHDPVKELTEALQMNMQIIRSNSMALDKYTNLIATLPPQAERSSSCQTTLTPVLREMLLLLREISDKHDRTNQILSGTKLDRSQSAGTGPLKKIKHKDYK